MEIFMKKNDRVNISPDLTNLPEWIIGTVLEVEENPFAGKVVSARTDDGRIFFGHAELFSLCINTQPCTH